MKEKIYKYFNKSIEDIEKKIGLDLKYFIKTGLWSSTIVFTEFIFGIIFSYLIANYLNKTDAGKFFFIISIIGVLGTLTLKGFYTVMTNLFLEKKYYYYKTITKLRTKASIIISLLLIIFSYISKEYLKQKIWPFFIIIAIYIPLKNYDIFYRYLYSKNNIELITKINLLKNIIVYTPTFYFLLTQKNLIQIMTYFLLSEGLFYIYYYNKFKKEIKIKKEKKIDKKILKDGFIFSLKEGIFTISSYIDKIVLPIFFDLKTLAIYSISLVIPKTLNNIFDKLYFYLFYKKFHDKKISLLNIKFLLFNIINLLLTIILIFATPTIFKIFFPKYLEYQIYSQLLIALLPLNLINLILIKTYESKNKSKKLIVSLINAQITQTILYLILIPIFSIYGAILVRFFKEIILLINFMVLKNK